MTEMISRKEEVTMKHSFGFALVATISLISGSAAAEDVVVVDQSILKQDVLAAQDAWCEALVDISTTYAESGHEAAKALAADIIDEAYAYQMGTVLFKPTLAQKPDTFRMTREGALSYFVGGDSSFPDDSGFALEAWKECEPQNAGIFIDGKSAITMGKVHFADQDGEVTTVDKTWGFVRDDAGALRINLHHSSLEYQPD
ncbi:MULTISPECIES: hypothetical protein [unclassified Thioalkalivibrio]|uniref:hypothetical protein n=1 Tax=unclassified Thioalkalivibrio TaxID=2621013 RepID=UPI00037ABE85|nr:MULTISPECIES: hypothetical protein [unclassified Thioalkalivibrio]